MDAMVGEAILSSFIGVLVGEAYGLVINFFQGKKGFDELFSDLKIKLRSAEGALNDADMKQLLDQRVKEWLGELKDVIYKADHLIDEINTEALRCKLEEEESGSKKRKYSRLFSTLFSDFDKRVKPEMENILHTLDLLLKQKDDLGLREGIDQNRPSQRLLCPLVVEESDVYGREADEEAIIKLLFSNGSCRDKISVISIAGMGGIGKTTLAQLVFNNSRVKDHFDLKAWVTVSEEFDVRKLTRIMFETMTSTKCDIEEPRLLQDKLKEELMGKRFLFVLDDVWNESYPLWDTLKNAFESGARGSKIIVTTRNKTVASVMGSIQCYELGTLFEEDCLKLFKRHAFNNVDTDILPDLQETISETVKKCKGLPLAVKAIAGLLRSVPNQEEWRKLLQNDVWELQFQENQKNNIPPALWFSYHFLPQQLKRCFAYCSIFPKDYQFEADDQEKLIWLWMAEGLLEPKNGKTMEDVGEEYLKTLVSRSFFQQAIGYEESILMMHDLVHDLAIRVSGEFYFIHDGSNYLHDCKRKIYHLSYLKRHDNMKLESLPEAKFLRTFLALPLSFQSYGPPIMTEKIQQELLLSAVGCLRALSLSESSITTLSDSISNLKHLRYLDLSWTKLKELPSSVCTLYNLQTLLLLGCRQLEQLPTNMCRLISLRHLVIRDTALKEMPPQMCKLTNLQTLSDFVLGEKSGSRIKELGALQNLRGSLWISGIENVVDIGDILEADLKKKEHLTELILMWKLGETDETSKATDVLNALEPHRNLKRLEIRGTHSYGKTSWIGGMPHSLLSMDTFALEKWPTGANQEGWLFPCLKLLHLSDCNKLNVGLPAGCLPSLKSIVILNCKEMVSVFPASQEIDIAYPSLESIYLEGGDKLNVGLTAGRLPSLESVNISYCNEMVSVFPASQEIDIAPSLKYIMIRVCDRVNVGLPASCLPSLESIEIWNCKEMVSVFPASQEIDIAYPSLQSINIFRCDKLNVGLPAGCLPSLKSIVIWDCNEMVSVFPASQEIDIAYPSFESIVISECENVESFSEMGLPSNLKELKLFNCTKLIANRRKWNLQRLSNLQTLILYGCEELVENSLPEEGLLPSSLTSLSIVGFTNLKSLNGKGFQHLTSLQYLAITTCEKVEWLPEEGLPLSLSTLSIYKCPLLSERCKRETGEDWPKIQHIPTIRIY